MTQIFCASSWVAYSGLPARPFHPSFLMSDNLHLCGSAFGGKTVNSRSHYRPLCCSTFQNNANFQSRSKHKSHKAYRLTIYINQTKCRRCHYSTVITSCNSHVVNNDKVIAKNISIVRINLYLTAKRNKKIEASINFLSDNAQWQWQCLTRGGQLPAEWWPMWLCCACPWWTWCPWWLWLFCEWVWWLSGLALCPWLKDDIILFWPGMLLACMRAMLDSTASQPSNPAWQHKPHVRAERGGL